MGTLQSGIELYDGFTAPLNNIITALNLTVSAFENMQRVSGNEIDTRSLEGMRDAADHLGGLLQDRQFPRQKSPSFGNQILLTCLQPAALTVMNRKFSVPIPCWRS